MNLERRLLARVDRRLLSALDHEEVDRMVKLPVSDAVWSTWRRYCDAVGVHMGRGLAILLHRELASVVDEDLEGLAAMLEEREAEIAAREAELTERESELERRETEVTLREGRLTAQGEGSQAQSRPWVPPKRGRNQACWCGSGKKFKNCHDRTTQ